MNNFPKNEHIYPHQRESSGGPLSPDDLARDVAENPEAYNKALVEQHIKPFIAHYGLQLAENNEGQLEVSSSRTIDDIIFMLSGSNKEDRSSRLTRYDAHALIEAGEGYSVADNLEKFTGIDGAVAHELIERGEGYSVVDNLEKFTDLDHNEIAHALIERGEGRSVASNLEKFTDLDHNEIAHELIERGWGYSVADNLEKFTDLDHNEIAHALIDRREGQSVAANLEKFTGLDHNEIAHALIERGEGRSVAANLEKFTGIDGAVAHALINLGYLLVVLQCSQSFKVSLGEIVLASVDSIHASDDLADVVVEHFNSYGFSNSESMNILTACATHFSTAQKIKQLDLEALVGVENAKILYEKIEHLKPELRGVNEQNPYEDSSGNMNHVTSSRPGTQFHVDAIEIGKRLRRPETEHDKEVAATIQSSYNSLVSRIKSERGEEYSSRLFGKRGDSCGDAWPTYRRLVADYLAVCGDGELEGALNAAHRAFEQVLRVDTTYYDKLFREWDSKRIGEEEFQEVFLGRDGVYAYVGRRAQIFARRRRLGYGSSDKAATFVDMPKYLIYSRGSRDSLSDEVKSVYLEQSALNPGAAHFYDTGFTGTIPEDIMRIMGVPESERDQRIRLLSANKRDRTVLGLRGSKYERDQIVNTIEYHVKDEGSSEGLYRNADGRLESYARPTSAEERLAFRMSQLALHRHYYVKEIKDTEPVNLGYKRYELEAGRSFVANIDKAETTEAIRSLFSGRDIGKQLLENAKSLKTADPSDPYPDEAVFEVALPGVGDAIIKTVITAKQQGPIDEFEALILLKKLGIDVPAPVARVFTMGKNGFIIMEKLQGESGRTIGEYFDEHRVSEQNQRAILQDAFVRMGAIAEIVHRDTGLDKPWRLKDFMVEYEVDAEGIHSIKAMKPIDFERAKVFDPDNPQSVKLGQGLDLIIGQ